MTCGLQELRIHLRTVLMSKPGTRGNHGEERERTACGYHAQAREAGQGDRPNAIGTNLYLMLYPLNGLAAILRKHPDRSADVHEILGRVAGHELRGEGRVYGGGLNKIEPSELGRISAAAFVERWPELRSSVQRQGELFGEQSRRVGALTSR